MVKYHSSGACTEEIPGHSQLIHNQENQAWEKGYECPCCYKLFYSTPAYREHFLREFPIDNEVKKFLDLDLGISLDSLPSKKPETTPNSPQSPCPKCQKTFKSFKGLKQHLAKAHQKQRRSSICSICGKGFKHKYARKFHIDQVHNASTRAECTLCGKVLYNKYLLTKHTAEKHQ